MKYSKEDKFLILEAFEIKQHECSVNEREQEIMMNIAKELNLGKCSYNKDTEFVECPVEKCEKCEHYENYFVYE